MIMKINRLNCLLIAIVVVLIALVFWHGKKQPVEMPPTTAAETNVAQPPAVNAKNAPVSAPGYTSTYIAQVPSNVPTQPVESKDLQMREGLAAFNDVDIEFFGRLEDQFGNAVGNAQIKFEVPFNNGHSVGVKDRRDAQHARASSGLGDIHAPNGSWLISPVEDLLFDLRPALSQVAPQLPHLQAVDPGGPLIGFHGLQRLEQVASLEHSFDEVFWFGSGLILAARKV